MTHFHADAPTKVDASNVAVGAVLQQRLPDSTEIHLDYISQFTSNIRYIDGSRNEVADALSRPSIAHLQLSPGIDLAEMAAEQLRVSSPCNEDVSGLQVQQLPLRTGNDIILCYVPTPFHRPFMPPSLRRKVFSSSLHNLSHPKSRATDKLIFDRFVWPGVQKDLKAWTRACMPRSLGHRGPLPLSNGCSYLLTCVDRFTRWPEAIPLPDTAAPTVVKATLSRRVAIFGVPSTVTTDRDAQFEFNLFQSLLPFLGCTQIRTTVYHPVTNGVVERFHCQLKTSIRAAEDPENWTDNLPLVLLGIRSAVKLDLDYSAADLAFDATVRLPGEIISPIPPAPLASWRAEWANARQPWCASSDTRERPSVESGARSRATTDLIRPSREPTTGHPYIPIAI
nr:unnamed protein product [Spirometra erinaceieuropaei]